MSLRNQTPRFENFARFLAALNQREVRLDRLRLTCWSVDGSVTIEEQGDPILADESGPEGYEPGEFVDRKPGTLLLRCDAADLFAIEVIEALGGQGHIA